MGDASLLGTMAFGEWRMAFDAVADCLQAMKHVPLKVMQFVTMKLFAGNVGEVMNVCCGDGAGENIAGETSSCSCGPNSKSSSLSYSPRLSALRKADILFIRAACKSRTVGKVVVHVLMENVEIELH